MGPKSELRIFLNYLLAAMSISSPAPTLSGALGDINNDVIVTTTSQYGDAGFGNRVPFKYLAHSPLPFTANFLRLPGKNDSVTTSTAVAACVAQILLKASVHGPDCPSMANPQVSRTYDISSLVQQSDLSARYPEETEEEAAEREKHPLSRKPQWMSIKAPEGDAALGNPIHLTLTLAPGKLSGPLVVVQSSPSKDLDGGDANIVQDDGLTKTIEVVPLQLGPVEVSIQAVYWNNTFVRQTIHLNVVPSAKGLKTFSLNQGTHFMAMVLENEEKDRQQTLRPMVTYEGVQLPIYLDDSSAIDLAVEQDGGNPVIRVDKNGTIHALNEGKAVLIGNFDGVEDRIQVTVYSKEDAPAGYGAPIQ